MRGRYWGLALLGAGTLAAAQGCGGDDDTAGTPRAGKGGASHAGAAGAGKSGGTSTGGRAGGNAGGTSGKGGKGAAGRSGAGQAGQAGQSGAGGGGGAEGGAESGGAPAAGAGGASGEGGAGGEGPTCDPSGALALLTTAPATLDLTGLYTSGSALPDDVAPYVREFAPRYPLWSDGATKRRWVYLPPCTQIDTSDMDHWVFPVGTRFWKEFTVTAVGGDVRVETRFIHRFGPGESDWLFAAYQWDPNLGASATAANTSYVPDGVTDANGTTHDIPNGAACTNCHGSLPEHILGFSAFELSLPSSGVVGGVSLATLGDEGLITVKAPSAGYDPPGDATAQAALGYLHANCGICHNLYRNITSPPSPKMRLLVGQTTVATTDTYTTLVNIPTQNAMFNTLDRIEPGNHAQSSVIARMSARPTGQMPPIGTEVVDATGVAAVSAWIDALPP
jgi:hypothetical protein